jgi:hypothetical protein
MGEAASARLGYARRWEKNTGSAWDAGVSLGLSWARAGGAAQSPIHGFLPKIEYSHTCLLPGVGCRLYASPGRGARGYALVRTLKRTPPGIGGSTGLAPRPLFPGAIPQPVTGNGYMAHRHRPTPTTVAPCAAGGVRDLARRRLEERAKYMSGGETAESGRQSS